MFATWFWVCRPVSICYTYQKVGAGPLKLANKYSRSLVVSRGQTGAAMVLVGNFNNDVMCLAVCTVQNF